MNLLQRGVLFLSLIGLWIIGTKLPFVTESIEARNQKAYRLERVSMFDSYSYGASFGFVKLDTTVFLSELGLYAISVAVVYFACSGMMSDPPPLEGVKETAKTPQSTP